MKIKVRTIYFFLNLSQLILLMVTPNSFGVENFYFSSLPSQEALKIGMRIWHNECAGKISGLVVWNYGENFASLGIGHFIWHPEKNLNLAKRGFSGLLYYMRREGVELPKWLDHPTIPPCPWKTREELMEAIKEGDRRIDELKIFLLRNIPIQVNYMIYRLYLALPKILILIPADEREIIYQRLYQLMHTEAGFYALIDYVNFKGDGAKWGLLQVLRDMKYAPIAFSSLSAYVWSARRVLIKRFLCSSLDRHEERWLEGWLNRVNSYLY